MITARDRFPEGVPVEWTDATGSYRALELPGGSRVAVECITHVETPQEIADAALAAHVAETTELAGIQLNADPLKRSKARPIEDCRSLKPSAGAASTHVLHTTIDGVRVKLLAIVDEDD